MHATILLPLNGVRNILYNYIEHQQGIVWHVDSNMYIQSNRTLWEGVYCPFFGGCPYRFTVFFDTYNNYHPQKLMHV